MDWDALALELAGFSDRLRPFIKDASLVLHRQMASGYSVLFEGAQATLLDVDHGSYPFVTSSTGVSGGAAIGLGVPPTRIDGVIGIAKAYTTRVGGGPLPTEIGGALEEEVRARGKEFGASTGRPRRCGWFDAVVVRYATRINGFDTLALTKLDVLDELDEVKVCTGYRFEGDLLTEMPADMSVLEACEPVYESLPGWKAPTHGARDLRRAAQGGPRLRRAPVRGGGLRDRHRLHRPRPGGHHPPPLERGRELVRLTRGHFPRIFAAASSMAPTSFASRALCRGRSFRAARARAGLDRSLELGQRPARGGPHLGRGRRRSPRARRCAVPRSRRAAAR